MNDCDTCASLTFCDTCPSGSRNRDAQQAKWHRVQAQTMLDLGDVAFAAWHREQAAKLDGEG
jgi:hypothetical protein